MKTFATDKTRNVLLIARNGEQFPDAFAAGLRAEAVSTGWFRASGVLRDVQLRAHAAELGGLASARFIVGPVQVVSMEGSIGLAAGDVSFGARAIIARETDRGLELLGGEIMQATIVALEAHVTALDDVTLPRALDREAGVWLFDASAQGIDRTLGTSFEEAPVRAPHADELATTAAAPALAVSPWGEAIAASDPAVRARTSPTQRSPGRVGTLVSGGIAPNVTGAMPGPVPAARLRPVDDDSPLPEAGDLVQHFAFGRAYVLKSDGDRLHLKVDKDGRIREIALEMLKVTPLDDTPEGKRSFRLDRRV